MNVDRNPRDVELSSSGLLQFDGPDGVEVVARLVDREDAEGAAGAGEERVALVPSPRRYSSNFESSLSRSRFSLSAATLTP
jgi:hypothetical protein